MAVRVKRDKGKGQCASFRNKRCIAMRDVDHIEAIQNGVCGTFRCPFYKPAELQELGWVRRDMGKDVMMIPPEEYDKEYARHVENKRKAEED